MPCTRAMLVTRLPMPVLTNSVSFTARCGMKLFQCPLKLFTCLGKALLRVAYAAIAQKLEPDRDLLSFIYPKWEFSCLTQAHIDIQSYCTSSAPQETGNRQIHSLNTPNCSQKIIKEIKKRLLSILQKKMQLNSKSFSAQFICGYTSLKVDVCWCMLNSRVLFYLVSSCLQISAVSKTSSTGPLSREWMSPFRRWNPTST